MPSTYTTNSGIEKPGSGEQSGTWGTTVNTNMDIIDRSVNGVKSIALTGTTSTLTTSDGLLSDGHYALIRFTGSLSAGHTVTVSPSDAEKVYLIRNNSGQTVTFTQGSGAATANVLNGESAIIYADGSDECHNLTDLLGISTPVQTEIDTKADLAGPTFTGTVTIPKATITTATVTTATITTGNITTVDLGNWTVTESAGVLYFANGGTNKMKLDSSGNLTVVGNVTAYGTV